jgi:hypothetical protein
MTSYVRRFTAASSMALALGFGLVGLVVVGMPSSAQAQQTGSNFREAGQRFQRGVALYGEADYHAALVEFKRAYLLAPNAAVLYNIGETQYQLQDYASALTTFTRYLAESGPTAAHRSEVESNVEILHARVGHLSIVTTPPGADITVDDQALGKTPFDKPFLVSIGHRKVIASIAGRPPITRYVDIAADDNASVSLAVPPATDASQGVAPAASATPPEDSGGSGSTLRVVGWIATGTFAAGAVVFGLLANKEAGDLSNDRGTYPVSASTLTHDSNLTTTYAVLSDSLTAAAIILGGITLYSTLSASSSSTTTRGSRDSVRVTLGPASARFQMTF